MNKRKTPYFFFALRSPYSWIAFRLLQERHPALEERLHYVPFWEPDEQTSNLLHELGGDSPYAPMSKAKHLYILQDIKRLTTKLGYQMAWPVDREPWWDLPHLAYLAAQRLGKGKAFIGAAYRARWQENRDICHPDVIQSLATEIGVEPTVLVAAPESAEIRAQGAQALFLAYRKGVFGVPFFAYGYEKFWGVDRLEDFVESMKTKVEGIQDE